MRPSMEVYEICQQLSSFARPETRSYPLALNYAQSAKQIDSAGFVHRVLDPNVREAVKSQETGHAEVQPTFCDKQPDYSLDVSCEINFLVILRS